LHRIKRVETATSETAVSTLPAELETSDSSREAEPCGSIEVDTSTAFVEQAGPSGLQKVKAVVPSGNEELGKKDPSHVAMVEAENYYSRFNQSILKINHI
jgi:hypothetical protein